MNTQTLTTDGLKYEPTGSKKPKKSGVRTIDQMSSARIIGHLIARHKVGLLFTWAIAMTVYAMAPGLVTGLIKGMF